MKATQNEHDVKFLALPQPSMVADMAERNLPPERRPSVTNRYGQKLWRIRQLQREAAVIALEACRPDDFRDSKRLYDEQVRAARMAHEERCVEVFSDYCTRGL